MFVISVSRDFVVGTVYTTHTLAAEAADRMGLKKYEILQVFSEGERVIFRDPETGVAELGTIKFTDHTENFYHVETDDGGGLIGARYTELTSAPSDAPAAPVLAEPKADDLSAALLATIHEYAEYDHPCDSDEGNLNKAHGAIPIDVLRELLALHS